MKPIDLATNSRELLSFLDKKREDRYFYRLVEITITVTVITFFLIFAVRPSILTISALVGEVKSKEKVSAQMRKKINDVVMAQEIYAQIQEKYQLLESALPESPQYAQLTEQIVAAGDYSQTPVTSIGFNLNQKDPNTIAFSFSQDATFTNIRSFVEKISKNRRLFQVNNISFGSQTKAEPDSQSISASYGFNSFYRGDNLGENEKK